MLHALLWTAAGVVSASQLGEAAIFLLVLVAAVLGASSTRRARILRRRRGFS
jgi:hypothetical protein